MSNHAHTHNEATMLQHTEDNTMAKSPYEIRLELIAMATSILTQQAEQKITQEHSNGDREQRAVKIDDFMPSSEEIIKEAEKLNEFVSNG